MSGFKQFLLRGNVVDLAVGVVQGRGLRHGRKRAGERPDDAALYRGYFQKQAGLFVA